MTALVQLQSFYTAFIQPVLSLILMKAAYPQLAKPTWVWGFLANVIFYKETKTTLKNASLRAVFKEGSILGTKGQAHSQGSQSAREPLVGHQIQEYDYLLFYSAPSAEKHLSPLIVLQGEIETSTVNTHQVFFRGSTISSWAAVRNNIRVGIGHKHMPKENPDLMKMDHLSWPSSKH